MNKTVKELFVKALRNGKVRVNYKKLNGRNRVFRATLNFSYIPFADQPEYDSFHTEDLIRFFSLKDKGWRSIKLDRLQSFSISPKEFN